jgi:hypothetical protein
MYSGLRRTGDRTHRRSYARAPDLDLILAYERMRNRALEASLSSIGSAPTGAGRGFGAETLTPADIYVV